MDNLPIPQSRIEELMNAFISRDSSRISTPQSRIEEFWYHLIEGTNALPIPQSRIELLLKKIIENDTQQIPLAQSRAEEFLVSILTGDTDKLPIPQSRSEYYLDYIARNNLVLDDIEYLKYNGTNITATNTVQKPFRSAILKGQTLVNLVPKKIIDHIASSDWDGYCCLVQNSKQSIDQWRTLQDLKPNTKYYISCYVETFEDVNNRYYCLNNPSTESIFEDSMTVNGVGRYQWLSTTKSELTDEIFIALRSQNAYARGAVKIRDIMIIEYQEGMENWDIPYFEGMQSVKMPVLTTTGKNLFDLEQYPFKNNIAYADGELQNWGDYSGIEKYFPVQPNTSYTFSNSTENRIAYGLVYYDANYNVLDYYNNGINTFTTPNFCNYIRFSIKSSALPTWVQIEEGSTVTSYEPYKSNILTVNEDVTLRGIGNVQDELDLLTGELTQRIGEVVLDGSENWAYVAQYSDGYIYQYKFATKSVDMIVDKLKNIQLWNNESGEGIQINDTATYIQIKKANITISDDFKIWLSQNPITVQYQLTTKSIKTVDLKVVDQDDNPVKQLSAFDETTHIVSSSASDNSLIAIAEVEVPTKLIEALDNIKLLSSDVGMLIDEVDAMQKTQDENSTMTMSAMTELYEIALMMGGNS